MTTDPLDLARRLREATYGMGKDGEPFDLTAAADLIESQHAELTRLRAVEKAAEEAQESFEVVIERIKSGNEGALGALFLMACLHESKLRTALREKGVGE